VKRKVLDTYDKLNKISSNLHIETTAELKAFTNGSLSNESILVVLRKIHELLNDLKYKHYHLGYAKIAPSEELSIFLKKNRGVFRYNSKHHLLIFLKANMSRTEKNSYLESTDDSELKDALEIISKGIGKLNSNKLISKLSTTDTLVGDALVSVFENTLPRINKSISKDDTFLSESIREIFRKQITDNPAQGKDNFFNEQFDSLKPYLKTTTTYYNVIALDLINTAFDDKKISVYQYLTLLVLDQYSHQINNRYTLKKNILNIKDSHNIAPHELKSLTNCLSPEEATKINIMASSLFKVTDFSLLERIKTKSIAVGGGKGGVGKSLTSSNLALYYASKGLKVGLVDVDPLSDIATIFGLITPKQVAKTSGAMLGFKHADKIDEHTTNIGKNLDLLFGKVKLDQNDSQLLIKKILLQYLAEIDEKYDLVIFDMPAGNRIMDNMIFTQLIDNFIIVTNPEPSAHESAGGYIKNLLETNPDINIHIWHNKFQENKVSEFDPRTVIANYNNNSEYQPERRITNREATNISDIGFIPFDNALTINNDKPNILIDVCENMIDILNVIKENIGDENTEIYRELKDSLNLAITSYNKFREYFKGALFSSISTPFNSVNRATKQFLEIANKSNQAIPTLQKNLGVFLFYSSLFNLFQSEKISKLIYSHIPMLSKNTRDRHTQIMKLLSNKDPVDKLVKTLLPVVNKQVESISTTYQMKQLIFNDPDIYENILRSLINNILYKGLGFIVSLNYRKSSTAFKKAANNLLRNTSAKLP